MRGLGLLAAAALAALMVLAALGALLVPSSPSLSVAKAVSYSGGNSYYTNFTVSPTGYVTVYLYGVPPASSVLLWWGLEPYAQGPWYVAVPETVNGTTYYVMSTKSGNNETAMTYNASLKAFVVTVGPFLNGTWMAYVFNVNNSAVWINYEGHAYWNFNVFVNPPRGIWGYTEARLLPNCTLEVTMIGRPLDTITLVYGITNGSQAGLPWYTTAGTPGSNHTAMLYSPLYGNYSALIGPFWNNTWVQWYYYDNTTGAYIYNSNVSATAPFSFHVYGSGCPSVVTLTRTVTVTSTTTSTTTVTSTVTSVSTTTATSTTTVTVTSNYTVTVTSTATSATATVTSTTTQTVTSTVTATSTTTATVTSTTTMVSPTTYTTTATVTSTYTSTATVTSPVTSTVTLTSTVSSVSTATLTSTVTSTVTVTSTTPLTYTYTTTSVVPTTTSVTITKVVVPAGAYAGVGAAAAVAAIAVAVAVLARRR